MLFMNNKINIYPTFSNSETLLVKLMTIIFRGMKVHLSRSLFFIFILSYVEFNKHLYLSFSKNFYILPLHNFRMLEFKDHENQIFF